MKEARADLSKLPLPGLPKTQLLSALVEAYCEVEMAKDALTRKSAEVAVPLEQAGLEIAEELRTQIGKLLLDVPAPDFPPPPPAASR